MKYTVSFTKWFTYSEIEADTEDEAEEKAYKLFNDGDDFSYTTEIVEIYEEES